MQVRAVCSPHGRIGDTLPGEHAAQGSSMTDADIIFAALLYSLEQIVAKDKEIAQLKMKYGVRP